MKRLSHVLLFAIVTILGQSSSQQKIELKSSVTIFFDQVDTYWEKNKENKNITTQEYDSNDIKILARQYYFAKAEDPIGFQNYIDQETQKLIDQNKNVKSTEIRLGAKIGIIRRQIASEYGDTFMECIGVPYFVKAKVLEINQDIYISEIEDMSFPKTTITLEVEEVVKGNYKFNEKDTIIVNYLNHWKKNSVNNFEIGNSYFVPIRTWGKDGELALDMLPDNNFGIYPIINNHVKIEGDYFLIGQNVEWNNFKVEFVDKYLYSN